jgi:putative ABC transport system permease protein
VFPLPLTYAAKMRRVPGVTGVTVGELVRRHLRLRAQLIAIALAGGALGIALMFPFARKFAATVGSMFPTIAVAADTVALQALYALAVGVVAAAWHAARARVVDGLRAVA